MVSAEGRASTIRVRSGRGEGEEGRPGIAALRPAPASFTSLNRVQTIVTSECLFTDTHLWWQTGNRDPEGEA